ncbi:MAG: glycosyltransferase family 4 protein [Verrucomicrobiota bacterium]
MKIAFVSRWLAEESRRFGSEGGPELQRIQAYEELGHEVIALSQASDVRGYFEERSLGGIRVILTHRWNRRGSCWIADRILKWFTPHRKLATDAYDLAFFLRHYGPFDVIEAQCEEPDGLVISFLSRFQKLPPWMVSVFSLRYHFEDGKPLFALKGVFQHVLNRADVVKVHSPLVQKTLGTEYGITNPNLWIVPPNLSLAFLKELRSIPVGADSNRILCAGALNEKKGVIDFVRAVRILHSKHPDWIFSIAGGSTSKDGYEATLKKEAEGLPIQWLGSLKPVDFQIEITRSCLVVVPSRFDEFNRAGVEVTLCGRPLVITETCGVADWVKRLNAGVVVKAVDPKDLARGIEEAHAKSWDLQQAQQSFALDFHPRAVSALSIQIMEDFIKTKKG